MSGTQGHGIGVDDTLKDFWATRPKRPRRGRKVAGVAAGIGKRYGLDPIVVRVAFVVATFYGGAGVLFYLLGWLLLPEQDDEGAPFESMVHHRRSSTSSAFTALLCLALIPAFWFLVDRNFGGILGLLIVGGALYMLHRTRGHLGRPPATSPPATETFAATGGDPVAYAPTASATAATPATPATEPTPPAWDPLGAAPFAWDLPEPSPPAPEPPQPRRKSKVGPLTVGAALVTAGGLALGAQYAGGWLTPAHIVGLVLGVLGLGMVGGSFTRGGRGLIGLAVPLSLAGIALTAITPHGWHGVGDLDERPLAISDVRDDYRKTAGSIVLDLTALPSSGEVQTDVSVDAGDIRVVLPADANVELFCKAGVGDLDCLGHQESGPDIEYEVNDDGPDGPGGLRIKLDASASAGTVEVVRGG